MRLSKAQVSAVSYELKQEFNEVGRLEMSRALAKAKVDFWKTPRGKALKNLRTVWKDNDLLDYQLREEWRELEEKLKSPMAKFRNSEIESAIDLCSIEAEDITSIKNEVRKHFYRKLTPAERKRFGLKI